MNAPNRREAQQAIEKELSDLAEKAGSLIDSCQFRKSYDLFGVLRSRAKSEGLLAHYVQGTFFQMDQAQNLLDFHTMRERAIELIAILEHEEQARKIQQDLDLQEYESLVHRMSACAYENLAEATGQTEGYNSEGMQACIFGGIDVCHRVGKLACVHCFREYACDVYLAADDWEIASHQCMLVLDHQGERSARGNRKWLAMKRLAWMDLLQGRLDSAWSKFQKAVELTDEEDVACPVEARFRTLFDLDMVHLLKGLPEQLPEDRLFAQLPARDQCPAFDLCIDMNRALAMACRQEWEEAEQLLIQWNRLLRDRKALHLGFETAVRLVAIKRLKGDMKSAQRLAKQFEEQASKASDYATIRRLNIILDEDMKLTPIGTPLHDHRPSAKTSSARPSPAKTDSAKLAATKTGSGTEDKSPADQEADFVDAAIVGGEGTAEGTEPDMEAEVTPPTPLGPWLDSISAQLELLFAHNEEETFQAKDLIPIRAEMLARPPEDFSHPEDAARGIFVFSFLLDDHCDADAIWRWANRIAAPHQEECKVLSVLGTLGMRLREIADEEFKERLPEEGLEQLFRKSLKLDSQAPNNHARAGEFFESVQNFGEAERCFARAFRLDRGHALAAVSLARIYEQTARPRDALHVLDLCIREGCQVPQVYFDAAMRAFGLEQYELMISYLEKLHEIQGNRPWTYYYLSLGYIEMGRYQEALDAMRAELSSFPIEGLHVETVLSASLAALGQHDEARVHLDNALKIPLAEIDYLSNAGIYGNLVRLQTTLRTYYPEDPLKAVLDLRLLRAGLADTDYFAANREPSDPQEVLYYRVFLRQPLDERWATWEGCMPGEQNWDHYIAEWGVLATSIEDAQTLAQKWQALCFPLEATLEHADSEETYQDRPGVVWQGPRFLDPGPPLDMDQRFLEGDEDEEDDDEDDDLPF